MQPLANVPDLYAALRSSMVNPDSLPELIAACDPEVALRLQSVDQGLLRAILRAGQGGPAIANAAAVVAHLRATTPEPLFHPDVATSPSLALPMNGQHPDMPLDRSFDAWFATKGVTYGIGLYGENRAVYRSAQFADAASPERRTIHLGIDIFAPAGTPVYAPLPGRVLSLAYNADPLDYGHTLILEHTAADLRFFTLYGHLAASLTHLLQPGSQVQPGQHIADLGDWHENGGWPAHLHFQIMTEMLEQTEGNFFGVGHASLWDIWQQISPDPNLVMRLPDSAFRL